MNKATPKGKIVPLPQLTNKRSKRLTESVDLDEKTTEIIDRIAREHGNVRRPFGYLEACDVEQEIWVICLEALPSYKRQFGPLENFLRVSVKNRLVNRFKEITKSVRSPCGRCEHFCPKTKKSDCRGFKDAGFDSLPGPGRGACPKWKKYEQSKDRRNSLLNAVEPIREVVTHQGPETQMAISEMQQILMDRLPKDLSEALGHTLEGRNIGKALQMRLAAESQKILTEAGWTV